MQTTAFSKFRDTLRSLFMLDAAAELDFGIYRVMNVKRREIEDFLDNRLRQLTDKDIHDNLSAEQKDKQDELNDTIEKLKALGAAVEGNPRVTALRKEIAVMGDPADMQAQVFTHLDIFFSRYYDQGDFISKRRYKKDVYAIPYEGEEVKLHWANADQYYIKTAENFRSYRFALADGLRCEFTLREATTEQNNNKAQGSQERRFALYQDEPLTVDGDTLHVNFTYQLHPKATKQRKLIDEAYNAVKANIPAKFAALLSPCPTEKDKGRTLLQKHLATYVSRNTADYFIHKDLDAFLSRELDFYIKNEILEIDDIDTADTSRFLRNLAVVKTVKRVGKAIIAMLAQLEDYQRRLWLKRKFVVQADYCLTLDRIPHDLYADICQCDAQRKEWVRLFAIDEIKGDGLFTTAYSEPLTVKFLEENPYLVLDTQFFSADFKHRLISSIDRIDEQCDGLLINSENFQALQLLQEKYNEKVNTIYVDPPYNTSASEILYKNSYKHSSWLSLIIDRFGLGKNLLANDGWQCTTIDDVEGSKLRLLLEQAYNESPMVVCIRINPHGRPIPNGFALSHEYAYFSRKAETAAIQRMDYNEGQNSRYREKDSKGVFLWELLRKAGSNSYRENRPTMFYPIYLNVNTGIMRIPDMEWDEVKGEYNILEETKENELAVYPIKDDGKQGNWYFGVDKAKQQVSEFKAEKQSDGNYFIYRRRRQNEGVQPTTFWDDSKYSATEHGTGVLKKLFGQLETFSYPKSIYAVEDCLTVADATSNTLILDFFAGSGTTAHAVINLNREDGEEGRRKYILCEMGDYFDTVTKPRVEKVVYSKDWKDGKPVSRQGSSHCFKYMRLEQYEDTLNNLVLQPQGGTISWGDDYRLGYMLNVESRSSLFSRSWFDHPFSVRMSVTRDNAQTDTTVDVVETFNYLLGLNVETMRWPEPGLQLTVGATRRGERTLVVWRDTQLIPNDVLATKLRQWEPDLKPYRRVYVNGDSTLAATVPQDVAPRIQLTDATFQRLMFE